MKKFTNNIIKFLKEDSSRNVELFMVPIGSGASFMSLIYLNYTDLLLGVLFSLSVLIGIFQINALGRENLLMRHWTNVAYLVVNGLIEFALIEKLPVSGLEASGYGGLLIPVIYTVYATDRDLKTRKRLSKRCKN